MSYIVKYEDIGLKDYKEVWDYQASVFNRLTESKLKGEKVEGTLIFVEHPHVYTLGKSGSENNLLVDHFQLQARDAKFYRIDRGGDITYHGPGQIVAYPVFDLEEIGIGLKEYISRLEETVIQSCDEMGISAGRLTGATGVWTGLGGKERPRKICAIGVRASRFVTMHGLAFNVNTDLSYFGAINPCGFTDREVTSLQKELGKAQDIGKVKEIVRTRMKEIFNLEWNKELS
ncbi:MAG TPA: lipoyl(octanoyl) transferase LipB [Bacteroidales bacterium]|nr:lipoyl(octanoyl) transferase LipB [Bacteroidales bacterium]HPF03007.1 lipoyl(octanoyl) transferase LipB [Bacteroidales bacterium]HPJ59968.1 lipoyl(octanoyl) transferase LipB [Bacteroidales bacterium]HPR13067.1 lipoyl(octanoyl) transferase LipB [Bacteroidales bacterium]HRW85687.1 lipoyl(octanoyl) transferase LipB [Bacteroidales bacterium]